MRKARKAITISAAVLWMSVILAAQQPADLVGTWSGDATLEGTDEPNTLTLVLEMKDGQLAGRMTDQYGAIDANIIDIGVEQGTFTFKVPVMLPQGGEGTIHFKMKILENSMKGEIEIQEMSAKGTWQASKEK